MIATSVIPALRGVRRLEYTWAFDAWAAAAWGSTQTPAVIASAPSFVREAIERLPDAGVVTTGATADSATRAAAAAGLLAGSPPGAAGAWGATILATPAADWLPALDLAAEQVASGAPLFVLATARLGWLLGPLRAGLVAGEAGAPVLRLAARVEQLEAMGFAVQSVTGLRPAASLAASVLAGVLVRTGRAHSAARWEQRARQTFTETNPDPLWSVMVLIEAVRR